MVPEILSKESTGGKTLPLHFKAVVFGDGVVGLPHPVESCQAPHCELKWGILDC